MGVVQVRGAWALQQVGDQELRTHPATFPPPLPAHAHPHIHTCIWPMPSSRRTSSVSHSRRACVISKSILPTRSANDRRNALLLSVLSGVGAASSSPSQSSLAPRPLCTTAPRLAAAMRAASCVTPACACASRCCIASHRPRFRSISFVRTVSASTI